jgi:hypothetical protein
MFFKNFSFLLSSFRPAKKCLQIQIAQLPADLIEVALESVEKK